MDPFVEPGRSQWVRSTLTGHDEDEDNDIMTTRMMMMMMIIIIIIIIIIKMNMKMKMRMKMRIIMVLMHGKMICESLVDRLGLGCISIHFDQHVVLIFSNNISS